MTRKWKSILAAAAAVLALSLGGGAVALAADPPAATSNPYLAAVAAKLGIGEAALTTAMKEARQQLADEAIAKALEKALANGAVTEQEAAAIKTWLAQQPDPADRDAMKAWWESRPQIAKPGVIPGLLAVPRLIVRWGYYHGAIGVIEGAFAKRLAVILGKDEQVVIQALKDAAAEFRAAAFEKALDNAVTNGRLTQDEADQIEAWWAQRPAALDKFAPAGGWGRIAPRDGRGPLGGGPANGGLRGMMWGLGGKLRGFAPGAAPQQPLAPAPSRFTN